MGPVLSTWVALSSLLEESGPPPLWLSITRMDMWTTTTPTYSRGDISMGAPTTIMPMERRWYWPAMLYFAHLQLISWSKSCYYGPILTPPPTQTFCATELGNVHNSVTLVDLNYWSLIISQTLLVAGGFSHGAPLSSTELLVGSASAWVYTDELPSPRYGNRGANIDNMVLMTGN